jgi:hypothetical protein
LKNNGGGHRPGRPSLVGRAMTVTDTAAALFPGLLPVTAIHPTHALHDIIASYALMKTR